ncbi:hypothetical protein M5689_012937 [Euphorbia peplus]|nr:hypothetical protein M5689_012937 [Euphorbia peplus]
MRLTGIILQLDQQRVHKEILVSFEQTGTLHQNSFLNFWRLALNALVRALNAQTEPVTKLSEADFQLSRLLIKLVKELLNAKNI